MASRQVHLAFQAHLAGALDFSAASRYEPAWRLKRRLVLNALEDNLAVEVNKLAHMWHCSAARANAWDEDDDDFEYHRQEAAKTFRTIGMAMLPWYKRWVDEVEEGQKLLKLWKEFKEEEKDPKFREWRDGKKGEMRERIGERKGREEALGEASKAVEAKRKEREKRRADGRKRRTPNCRLRR